MTTTFNPRIFKYGDLEFPGDGELFTHPVPSEEVLKTLTATFPELANATIEVERRNDGVDVVTFAKRAGTLG